MITCPECHKFLDPVSWLKSPDGRGYAEFICIDCKLRMTYTVERMEDTDNEKEKKEGWQTY